MIADGIKEFQFKRKEIMQTVVDRASKELLADDKVVDAKNVAEKVRNIFKDDQIAEKYFIGEQSIGRNLEYSKIWKQYRRIQKERITLHGKKYASKKDEFDVRDKYDLLSQDYIELLDKYNWLDRELEEQKKRNELLTQNTLKPQARFKSYAESKVNSDKIIKRLKQLVDIGPTIIIKSNKKVIIKSYLNDEDKRYEFTEAMWDEI